MHLESFSLDHTNQTCLECLAAEVLESVDEDRDDMTVRGESHKCVLFRHECEYWPKGLDIIHSILYLP
jgi:hypothetical protein